MDHARRKFVEASKAAPSKSSKGRGSASKADVAIGLRVFCLPSGVGCRPGLLPVGDIPHVVLMAVADIVKLFHLGLVLLCQLIDGFTPGLQHRGVVGTAHG
jgi:hypothetical protein